jgi:tetratricopeptide (TPR) repeat protein
MKQKGLEYLKKAVHFAPNSYSHNFDYAFNLNESKKNAQTIIKHYEKCIEIDDYGIGPYHNIGRIYSHYLKEYQKALEVMKIGNDKFPCADTMIEMALAEENIGNIDTARNYLEMAIKQFSESDLAYNNLAFLLWQNYNEPDYAKFNIEKALEIKPYEGLYWHTLAEVEWYAFKNKEKALEALYKAKKVQKSYKGGDEMIAELEKI